jgi:rhodanese-related sulfurtransferase
MVARLTFQVLTLALLSAGLATLSIALRSGGLRLDSDPETFRYRDVEFISIEDASALHDEVTTLFLDARPAREFETRRVFGAVSFPADALDSSYAELRDFLDREMTLVVYSKELPLAVRVSKFLDERGYHAPILEGGWEAWRDGRLPVE